MLITGLGQYTLGFPKSFSMTKCKRVNTIIFIPKIFKIKKIYIKTKDTIKNILTIELVVTVLKGLIG